MHCLHNYWFCYQFNKKNHPQVYLEECKCRIKKTQISKFIRSELKSDSESDSDLDDKELISKLKDYDYDYNSDSEVESKSNAKKLYSE